MIRIVLGDINHALAWSGLKDDDYELKLTGNGYVITFPSLLDSHRFTLGMLKAQGSLERAMKVYDNVRVQHGPEGVEMTFLGSYAGF